MCASDAQVRSREARQDRTTIRRIAAASLIGTLIEWYDFFLYAAMSALVFNHVFFPALSDAAGTLASFATFGAAFVARPIGSVVMGHFGDRYGRKVAMVTSLVTMGSATVAIGLIPTYVQIGIAAPAILTCLRFVQGIALGGEWSGAVTLAMEHAPPERKGRWAAWVQYGALAGIALSTGSILLLVETLSREQLLSWGWRVPFLASGLLVGVGMFVRLRIEESPVFRQLDRGTSTERFPVWETVRDHGGAVARVAGMHLVVVAFATTLLTFYISYGVSRVGYSRTAMLEAMFIGTTAAAVLAPALGGLSDVLGRQRVYIAATAAASLGAFPSFVLLNSGHLSGAIAAVLCLTLPIAAAFQAQGAYFPEQFPPYARVTGAGLGASLASAAAGGPAPAVAQSLMQAGGGRPWWVATYLTVIALISLGSAALTPDVRPAPRRPADTQRDRWVGARRRRSPHRSGGPVPASAEPHAEVGIRGSR